MFYPELPAAIYTEKWQNKADLKFEKTEIYKKTSMSESVKSLVYIMQYNSSSPRSIKKKAQKILSNRLVKRAVEKEDLKLYWKSEIRPHLEVFKKTFMYKFFKDILGNRKKTKMGVDQLIYLKVQ